MKREEKPVKLSTRSESNAKVNVVFNDTQPIGITNIYNKFMRLIHRRSLLLLLAVTAAFAAQAAVPSNWRLECVGRSNVSLPSDVEMAALSFDSFAEEIGGGSRLSVSQFRDGQLAGWSRISYLNGLLLISNELDAAQIADLRSLFIKQPELKREQLKKRDTAKSRATVVSDVKVTSPQVMSWGYASHTLYLHQLQNHFLTTGFTSDSEMYSASNETFDLFAKNASYRQLFSIPRGNGVCLPYAFIGDKGREPREISISYRIKSHPDVMIVLTDASAEDLEDSRSALKTPEDEINDFWSQYEVSRTGKKVSSHWLMNSKRTIKLDGRKGVASFVNITRKDDSKDIGYLAVVPGDPQAKLDVPKLRLFVVREGNHARTKGVEPIGEKAFLELVEQIAGSVQVRRD